MAGTNGKGSTCAAIAGFLQAHTAPGLDHPIAVGLYTSPHVVHVRERICLQGKPISKDLFAKRYFEVEAKLPLAPTEDIDVPRYLQFLCLLSVHVFIQADVNVAVYEAHMGGEYDATNIFRNPAVTVVTPISRDHVGLLGPDITDIAWHKAGIFKQGSIALSAPQNEAVTKVLQQRAIEKGVRLRTYDEDFSKENGTFCTQAQLANHQLAAAAGNSWLAARTDQKSRPVVAQWHKALSMITLPGRFQIIHIDGLNLYLDGAHNEDKIEHCSQWFIRSLFCRSQTGSTDGPPLIVLVFAHFSDRDSCTLLGRLLDVFRCQGITLNHVVLTSYNEWNDGILSPGIFTLSVGRS